MPMTPRLAGPQVASDVLVVMLAVRRRREQGDVAADQFGGGIAEQARDVPADEARREIVTRLEAVDDRGRSIEQTLKPRIGGGLGLGEMKPLAFLLLACRVGQDSLDDVGYVPRIRLRLQHLSTRGRSNLGVFSGGHGGNRRSRQSGGQKVPPGGA